MSKVRIVLPNSSYAAYLSGITGALSRTRSVERIDGKYEFKYRAHVFDIAISGQYKLYLDKDRNGTFSVSGDWSDNDGNFLPGDDMTKHLEGHGTGADFKIATDDIYDGNVSPVKTNSFEDF